MDELPLPALPVTASCQGQGRTGEGPVLEPEDNTGLVPPLHPRANQGILAGTIQSGLSFYIWKMVQITLHELIKCLTLRPAAVGIRAAHAHTAVATGPGMEVAGRHAGWKAGPAPNPHGAVGCAPVSPCPRLKDEVLSPLR